MNNYGDIVQKAWEWSKLVEKMYHSIYVGAFYQPKRSTKIKNKRRNKRK